MFRRSIGFVRTCKSGNRALTYPENSSGRTAPSNGHSFESGIVKVTTFRSTTPRTGQCLIAVIRLGQLQPIVLGFLHHSRDIERNRVPEH